MTKFFGLIMRRTQKIVKRHGVSQTDHIFHVFRSYVNQKGDAADKNTGTISRWMSGKTLPPWDLVTHYAGYGTRCPEALVMDLHNHIMYHYNTQSLRNELRTAIMEVLSTLPKEDQEDICGYWEESNLAHMWAVLLWYAMTCDYAATTWTA